MFKKFIKEMFKAHIVPIVISCSVFFLSAVCMVILPGPLCKNISVEKVMEDYTFSSYQTTVICSKIQYSEDFSLKTVSFKDLSSNKITTIETTEEYILGQTYLANNFKLAPASAISLVGRSFKSTIISANTVTTSIEQLAEDQYNSMINQAVKTKIKGVKELTTFVPLSVAIGVFILFVIICFSEYSEYKYFNNPDKAYEK